MPMSSCLLSGAPTADNFILTLRSTLSEDLFQVLYMSFLLAMLGLSLQQWMSVSPSLRCFCCGESQWGRSSATSRRAVDKRRCVTRKKGAGFRDSAEVQTGSTRTLPRLLPVLSFEVVTLFINDYLTNFFKILPFESTGSSLNPAINLKLKFIKILQGYHRK